MQGAEDRQRDGRRGHQRQPQAAQEQQQDRERQARPDGAGLQQAAQRIGDLIGLVEEGEAVDPARAGSSLMRASSSSTARQTSTVFAFELFWIQNATAGSPSRRRPYDSAGTP